MPEIIDLIITPFADGIVWIAAVLIATTLALLLSGSIPAPRWWTDRTWLRGRARRRVDALYVDWATPGHEMPVHARPDTDDPRTLLLPEEKERALEEVRAENAALRRDLDAATAHIAALEARLASKERARSRARATIRRLQSLIPPPRTAAPQRRFA